MKTGGKLNESNQDKLFRIFREVFGLEKVSLDMTKNDIAEWNSLQTINLIIALEESFQVEFQPEEAADMLSIGIVKDILVEKGISF